MKRYSTDYFSHDSGYRYNRAKGFVGWSRSDDDYIETHKIINNFLFTIGADQSYTGLDLGCGAGNNTIFLANKGFKMSGIDISPYAIEWAKERVCDLSLDINFLLGSAIDLDKFNDQSFDFVIDSHCFHCIIGEDRENLLKNVKRVLKRDGYFLIMTMCLPIPKEMENCFDSDLHCMIREGKAARYIGSKEDIIDEIKKGGLTIVKVDYSDSEGNGYLVMTVKR